jgi:adenosine kinase
MQTLKKANEAESVQSAYQVQPSPAKTGACAVVITGHHRSLCTTLRAAEMFTPAHLATPEIATLLDGAKYFYIEGYFLTHGSESAMEVAKAASSRGKTVVLNLSAPFIPQFFKVQLEELLPHVDVLIGNESEAAAYAEAAGLGVSSPYLLCVVETPVFPTLIRPTGDSPRAGGLYPRRLL